MMNTTNETEEHSKPETFTEDETQVDSLNRRNERFSMKKLSATLALGFAFAMTIGYNLTTHAQQAPKVVQVADGGLGDTLDGILDCLGID
jgi:hypothetical protein